MKVQAWAFLGQIDVEIPDDGRIDKWAKYAFSNGHCHSLALALNELTGWPLYGMQDDDGMAHVFVKSPRGYVDIEGPGVTERWHEGRVVRLTREKIEALDGYLEAEPRIALPFAVTVLRTWFPEVAKRVQTQTGAVRCGVS